MARDKTKPTLAQIDAEIARLQRQRDAVRSAEVAEVVSKIRAAIDHYGLTSADLGFGVKHTSKQSPKQAAKAKIAVKRVAPAKKAEVKSPAKTAAKSPGVPKYADGSSGRTWTGNGQRPAWFVAAIESGKTPADLLIRPVAA